MGSDGTMGLARMRRGPVAKKERKSSLWRRKVTLNREELPGSQLNPSPIFCSLFPHCFQVRDLICTLTVVNLLKSWFSMVLNWSKLYWAILYVFFFLLENESVLSVDEGLVFRVGLLKVKVHKNMSFFCYPQQKEAHGLTCETPALKAAGLDVALPVKPSPLRRVPLTAAKSHSSRRRKVADPWAQNSAPVKYIAWKRLRGQGNKRMWLFKSKESDSDDEMSAEVSLRQGAGWSASAEPGSWKCALGCFTPSGPRPPTSSQLQSL